MENLYAVVLAGGKGTRMKTTNSNVNKVMYPILGKPIIEYVLDSINKLDPQETIVVTGFGSENTANRVQKRAKLVQQVEIKGTGHAVNQAAKYLKDRKGITVVMYGDTPLLQANTLENLVRKHIKENSNLTVLTSVLDNPKGYNKIVREYKTERVLKINDKKEGVGSDFTVTEVDGGVYVFDNELLFKYLPKLKPDNDHGEYSLISLAEMFVEDGYKVETYIVEDRVETFSINDRFQLSYASKVLRKRINMDLMLKGVSLEDPDAIYISPDVIIGPDTIIHPNTTILGKCFIGKGNEIGPGSYLENVVVGDNNIIRECHIVDTTIKNNNDIGPYIRMRGNTIIENNTRIGNFVELKNAHFEDGVKCAHLTYIGDAHVGEHTNIGCGSVTANYDGFNKMHTEIGKNAFIGSGTILVAPVNVADNGFTAAGSTITKDVEEDAMVLERAPQVSLEHGASRFLAKAKKKKEESLKSKK